LKLIPKQLASLSRGEMLDGLFNIQNKVGGGGFAVRGLLHLHHEARIEEKIPLVARLVGELELRRQDTTVRRLYLDVDMGGATAVLSRKDRLESIPALLIRKLVPPQLVSGVVGLSVLITVRSQVRTTMLLKSQAFRRHDALLSRSRRSTLA
jgi:hypothetical protein